MSEEELENKKHEYLIAQLEMLENEELEKMLFLENFVKYHGITTEKGSKFSTKYIQMTELGEAFDFNKVKGHQKSMYRKNIYVRIYESGYTEIRQETDEDVIKKLGLTLKENKDEH